jgi:hypothetical protein
MKCYFLVISGYGSFEQSQERWTDLPGSPILLALLQYGTPHGYHIGEKMNQTFALSRRLFNVMETRLSYLSSGKLQRWMKILRLTRTGEGHPVFAHFRKQWLSEIHG